MDSGILKKWDEVFADSEFEGTAVRGEDGLIYFQYPMDECSSKEGWDRYCDIQEELRVLGLEIKDVYIEHDFISGIIVWKLPN